MNIDTLQDSEATGRYQKKQIKNQDVHIKNPYMDTCLKWYTTEEPGL